MQEELNTSEQGGDAATPGTQHEGPSDEARVLLALGKHPLMRALLDATDVAVLVLNGRREIVLFNSAVQQLLGTDDVLHALGLRPGNALACIHATSCAGGCGTTEHCSTCGAWSAVTESQRTGATVERECLMTVRRGTEQDSLELRVRTSQVLIDDQQFTVMGLRDISAEKRRAALERVFLHDLANAVSPLVTWAQVLRAEPGNQKAAQRIELLARQLNRDIEDQRVLQQAENGTLRLRRAPMGPEDALRAAMSLLDGHPLAQQRTLRLLPRSPLPTVVTDEALVVRILLNMIKNALEATAEGGAVELWADPVPGGGCVLAVWNPGAMPREVALRVFKRSFSTKPGIGRGLGTFSMKLLGERYLGGNVGFSSTDEGGTVFFLRLPG